MNYSQNKEQEIILNYFGDYKGTFLDMGANDGKTFSNTYALSQLGWVGVLIEPSPKAYERLLKNYEGLSLFNNYDFRNVAVGGFDGTVTLHESGELLGQGDTALVSSIRPKELKRWESINMQFEKVNVKQLTWRSLWLDLKYQHYDFISIDIEGMEIDVIKQMNLKALGVKLICVEWNSVGFHLYDVIIRRYGYELIHKNSENLIYGVPKPNSESSLFNS